MSGYSTDQTRDLAAATAGAGNVYIFNNTNNQITSMTINTANPGSGSIAAWSTASTSMYAPAEQPIARSQFPVGPQPVFVAGQSTQVTINWVNFQGTFTVTSPSTVGYDIGNDLILLVSMGGAVLLDNQGRVIGNQYTDNSGNPIPQQVLSFAITPQS
jgi:hypothetical protein